MSMKELFDLFLAFERIGALTFGGGYAMLPMLQKEVVDKYHWATEDELMDYYAIGQCTPGIIAVNTATFIGYKRRGLIGAAFSTLGMVFPSLVIITVIAAFIQNFAHIEAVQHAFAGIRVAVCVLILTAVTLLIAVDGFDFTTNFSATMSCFNNIGPGLSVVGPMSNYSAYSPFSKLLLSFAMLAGRLEVFPIVLLFSPRTWRRSAS